MLHIDTDNVQLDNVTYDHATFIRSKQEICEIGRRIYAKGFAAANDGNISYRLGENEVLCTPTMICKGFMKPDDLCTVDMEGKQLAGKQQADQRSPAAPGDHEGAARREERRALPSAARHGVRRRPRADPAVRAARGRGVSWATCRSRKYETPGGQEFADTVLPFVHKTNVIILANHGTVSFGETVEQAYWWTEILDAYCRILMLASELGSVNYFNEQKTRELLDLKTQVGLHRSAARAGMENCDICANDIFRDSWKTAGRRAQGVRRAARRWAPRKAKRPPRQRPRATSVAMARPMASIRKR